MKWRTVIRWILPGIFFLIPSLASAAAQSEPCRMSPSHREIRVPTEGFSWLEGEEFEGECDEMPANSLGRESVGVADLLVFSEGPQGSGRYWNVLVALAAEGESEPERGFCLMATTVGWRTLQKFEHVPLRWVDDLDGDGTAELIVWDSFPITADALPSNFGLSAWVYRFISDDAGDLLAIDWELSRAPAKLIAAAYRSPLQDAPPFLTELREAAARALDDFAENRCVPPER